MMFKLFFTNLLDYQEILLVDMGFGQWLGTADEAVLVPAWHGIKTANFSRNQITYIDESVVSLHISRLYPSVLFVYIIDNSVSFRLLLLILNLKYHYILISFRKLSFR